ncbi:hypothetical protein HK414_13035 [Ramlibacter terrae]|uniref:Uncharacterized protein n=1 Tax=Ramlibacter terrae TaxID=2732511 RepID=A0ABX6P2T7_9BURK|nr:hypothetical protein HK414_13035 [Ramlibacter terrae]
MSETFSLSDVRKMAEADSSGGGETFSIGQVRAMAQEQPAPATGASALALVNPAVQAAALFSPEGRTQLGRFAAGGVRGAADIGNTILNAGGWLADKGINAVRQPTLSDLVTGKPQPGKRWNADREASLNEFFDERIPQGDVAGNMGRIGMNVAGTMGVGPAMAFPLRAAGAAVPALSSTLTPVANAVSSSGMSTGLNVGRNAPLAARAGDMALRVAGGAAGGYAGAGLVDPNSAEMGALFGGAAPPVLQGARAVTRGLGTAASALRPAPGVSGADMRSARDIAAMAGVDPNDLQAVAQVRDALRQSGPGIIPGQRTVPEILQMPGVSQLQRSVQAVQPAPFVARNAEREGARREVLERIAPIGNRAEVQQEVGDAISEYAIPAHQQAQQRVSRLFEGVDPFGEARVNLPIDEMQAGVDRFLGPGTFGTGRHARGAVDEARRIGTMELPAITPTRVAASRQPQDLLQAVRQAGGINPLSAGGMNNEIREFGQRQARTTGLVRNQGRTIDELAGLMHERGYLQSADPAELLEAMRLNLRGQPVYAADIADDAFRGRLERSMGDAPQGGAVPQPVPFDELQNLRSSITEKWAEARKFGNNREAAALDVQRKAIDAQLERLAAGEGQPGEYFGADMVQSYQQARQAHAAKQQQFKTGPQAGMFRRGGSGLPQMQGGQIPPKFFNGNGSQVSDAQSFRRLVQDDPRLMDELRRYAVSEGASKTTANGNLSASKFGQWLDSRAGATGEIFSPQQQAWLKAIAEDLKQAANAESLGRSTGSDTAQKAASMMRPGLLDNPGARYAVGKIPGAVC